MIDFTVYDKLGDMLFRLIRWLVVIALPLSFAAGFAVRGCVSNHDAQPAAPAAGQEDEK